MSHSRSEYLRINVEAPPVDIAPEVDLHIRPASEADRDVLADLVLDAYHGTIDDEGEGVDEARQAVDDWMARRITGASVVVEEGERIVAMSFAVEVGGRVYIDPVVTASSRKRRGIGRRAVSASLERLEDAGVNEVGATITDGNVASEQLFASLGFAHVGPWGPSETSDGSPSTRPDELGPRHRRDSAEALPGGALRWWSPGSSIGRVAIPLVLLAYGVFYLMLMMGAATFIHECRTPVCGQLHQAVFAGVAALAVFGAAYRFLSGHASAAWIVFLGTAPILVVHIVLVITDPNESMFFPLSTVPLPAVSGASLIARSAIDHRAPRPAG